MLHWGVQCENRKKNTSAQNHIYHKHITLQQGETYLALASSHPVWFHLFRCRSQTRFDSLAVRSGRRQLVGGGSNVCNRGGGARESHCSALPRVVIQHGLGRGRCRCGGARKDTIDLFCLWGCIPSQLFSLSILVSESINFHLQSCELHRDRIRIPVNSLSFNADRSSHSFNQNGQPCETLDSCSRLLNFSITQGKA